MVVVMVMIVTAGAFLTVVIVVMLMLMIVVMMMLMLMVVVMMMPVLVIVIVVVMTAGAFLVLIMVMMVLVCLFLQMLELRLQRRAALHGLENLRARDLVPRGGDDGGDGVFLAQHGDAGIELLLAQPLRAGEDDGAGVLDLVVEELAEVLHIDLALRGVHDGGEAVEHHFVRLHALHGADDVRELADAGGLDEDAVGMELLHHLTERGGKVAHERAADAAGVHLVDRHARVLQETAVDGDLAELVFDEDDLLALIGLSDQLFDEGRLPRAEKAGENINFGHDTIHFLSEIHREMRLLR